LVFFAPAKHPSPRIYGKKAKFEKCGRARLTSLNTAQTDALLAFLFFAARRNEPAKKYFFWRARSARQKKYQQMNRPACILSARILRRKFGAF
jgi:hypothetical protein